MTSPEKLIQTVGDLLSRQKLCVLSSHDKVQPYASLVAFAATDDLRQILFATTRATRKYSNLMTASRVALLFDDRANEDADFYRATAATAIGMAREVREAERAKYTELYLAKHPQLRTFVSSPSCALLNVGVEQYYVVSRFQNVQVLHIST